MLLRMRVGTPHFALELPDGWTVDADGDVWSASHEGERLQITVSTRAVPSGTPLVAVLHDLATAREAVLREAGIHRVVPVEGPALGELHRVSFLAWGEPPVVVFATELADPEPLLGSNPVVSFSVLRHLDRTPDDRDLEPLRLAAEAILPGLDVAPHRASLERAQRAGNRVDLDRLYPYIVPTAYLESRPRGAAKPRALGHGLYLAFGEDHDGIMRVLHEDDLAEHGTLDALLDRATQNLQRALRAQDILVSGHGPPDALLVFGRDWRAASCLLLPDLHDFASRTLSTSRLVATVPHRDVLVVFADEGPAHRLRMLEEIERVEADGPKRLTPHLFTVTPAGPVPFGG